MERYDESNLILTVSLCVHRKFPQRTTPVQSEYTSEATLYRGSFLLAIHRKTHLGQLKGRLSSIQEAKRAHFGNVLVISRQLGHVVAEVLGGLFAIMDLAINNSIKNESSLFGNHFFDTGMENLIGHVRGIGGPNISHSLVGQFHRLAGGVIQKLLFAENATVLVVSGLGLGVFGHLHDHFASWFVLLDSTKLSKGLQDDFLRRVELESGFWVLDAVRGRCGFGRFVDGCFSYKEMGKRQARNEQSNTVKQP